MFRKTLLGALRAFKSGNPLDAEAKMGPMARAHLMEVLKFQVHRTVSAGATLAHGNKEQLKAGMAREGVANTMDPVVLEGIIEANPGYSMEFFGPVISLYEVGSEQAAIELANDVSYGLGGAVFSKDEKRAERVAMQLETGNVMINGMFLPQISMPFGGVKDSGYGRQGGTVGFH